MDPDRLPAVLRGVLAGEAAIPRTLVTRLVRELTGWEHRRGLLRVGDRQVRLTSREWETLTAMRERLTTSQMGERFGVAPVTVRSQVASIVRKLRVPDRDEAVRLLGAVRDSGERSCGSGPRALSRRRARATPARASVLCCGITGTSSVVTIRG
jgi:DNA-binding NarL/FixJ family response regulator